MQSIAGLNIEAPPLPIPTPNTSVRNFVLETVADDAQATKVVIHPSIPPFLDAFLIHKRIHGSTYEKQLYTSTFTTKSLVTRLIKQRPLAFLGSQDTTMLRTGEIIGPAAAEWDRVGTSSQSQNRHLFFPNYLSYDEILLSSLIGASGPTHFINPGQRHNRGRLFPGRAHEPRGIIIGLVGPRFEREDHMDDPFIIKPNIHSQTPPRMHPELASLFRTHVYSHSSPTDHTFNVTAYQSRLGITIETLLLEANSRARLAKKEAYVHVVGLGLGVWSVSSHQPNWYLEAFTQSLSSPSLPKLEHISILDFSYIPEPPIEILANLLDAATDLHNMGIKFSQRDPAAKLVGVDADKLLVVSYAWDGNAFPGNEYWMGMLSASGDPAAASCSMVGELHNPMVNPGFAERVNVVGENGGTWL